MENKMKGVLVTGGSGAVGGAIVRRFCQDGIHVAFTYNNRKAEAEKLAKETGAQAFHADLTKGDQVQTMVEAVEKKMGHIDVLINNAGRTQVMPFALIEEDDWDVEEGEGDGPGCGLLF